MAHGKDLHFLLRFCFSFCSDWFFVRRGVVLEQALFFSLLVALNSCVSLEASTLFLTVCVCVCCVDAAKTRERTKRNRSTKTRMAPALPVAGACGECRAKSPTWRSNSTTWGEASPRGLGLPAGCLPQRGTDLVGQACLVLSFRRRRREAPQHVGKREKSLLMLLVYRTSRTNTLLCCLSGFSSIVIVAGELPDVHTSCSTLSTAPHPPQSLPLIPQSFINDGDDSIPLVCVCVCEVQQQQLSAHVAVHSAYLVASLCDKEREV